MNTLVRCGLGGLTLVLAITACVGAAAQVDSADFAAVRRDVQAKMRSRKPEDRAAALASLQGHAGVEAAKLVVQLGFKDRDALVRKAAYETLLKFTSRQDVCDFLLATLRKDATRASLPETMYPLLAVLLAAESPQVERELLEAFDKLAESKHGAPIPTTLADEFGNHDDAAAVASLAKLTKSKTFTRDFGFRRAVVQALVRMRQPQAVELLIDLLAKDRGEIRSDIIAYLGEISGQALGADSNAWREWWRANKGAFKFPPAAARAANREAAAGVATYYGLPLYAQRLVFVLDTSGSMAGPRLEAAKRELIAAVEALPDYGHFALVSFNTRVDTWQKQLVPASLEAKKGAARYVAAQKAEGTTASYDALEAALRFDAEAIYFLSDGAPQGGKITAPGDIIEAIRAMNRLRRVSIYTIGIGPGAPGGSLDAFLDQLAQKNFGAYRRVDQ